jgi:hypothetical protein
MEHSALLWRAQKIQGLSTAQRTVELSAASVEMTFIEGSRVKKNGAREEGRETLQWPL